MDYRVLLEPSVCVTSGGTGDADEASFGPTGGAAARAVRFSVASLRYSDRCTGRAVLGVVVVYNCGWFQRRSPSQLGHNC